MIKKMKISTTLDSPSTSLFNIFCVCQSSRKHCTLDAFVRAKRNRKSGKRGSVSSMIPIEIHSSVVCCESLFRHCTVACWLWLTIITRRKIWKNHWISTDENKVIKIVWIVFHFQLSTFRWDFYELFIFQFHLNILFVIWWSAGEYFYLRKHHQQCEWWKIMNLCNQK